VQQKNAAISKNNVLRRTKWSTPMHIGTIITTPDGQHGKIEAIVYLTNPKL